MYTLLFKSGGKRDRRINLFRNKFSLSLVLEKFSSFLNEMEHFNRDSLVVVPVTLVCGATLVSPSASLFSDLRVSRQNCFVFREKLIVHSFEREETFFSAKSCKSSVCVLILAARIFETRSKKKKRKRNVRKLILPRSGLTKREESRTKVKFER